MKTLERLVLLMTFIELTFRLSHCLSAEKCPHVVTVNGNQTMCGISGLPDSAIDEWLCADLQSALKTAVDILGDDNSLMESGTTQQNSSNCVQIKVPPGDHFISAPLYFGATSLYLFGLGEGPDDVTIFCTYTVDVNESRMFDSNYDYTFYFDRSQQVSIENVQFVGCPFPLRMDTVATVGVDQSMFR